MRPYILFFLVISALRVSQAQVPNQQVYSEINTVLMETTFMIVGSLIKVW